MHEAAMEQHDETSQTPAPPDDDENLRDDRINYFDNEETQADQHRPHGPRI